MVRHFETFDNDELWNTMISIKWEISQSVRISLARVKKTEASTDKVFVLKLCFSMYFHIRKVTFVYLMYSHIYKKKKNRS